MSLDLVGVDVNRGPRPVIRDCTIALESSVSTLMGPNGSGKTTLLEALAGIRSYRGQVSLDGRVLRFPRDLGLVGYAPQEIRWPTRMTPLEICVLADRLRRGPSHDRRERVGAALTMAGAQTFARDPAGTLSSGQTRRLSLAQALVNMPRLLILDEPTSELDPLFCDEFGSTIADISQRCQVVVSTHSLDDAARWPGGVYLVHGGTLHAASLDDESPTVRLDKVRAAFRELAAY